MALPPSELILNADGSIYHLHLLPADIADTVILVGDPERVSEVSKYFDRIEIRKEKREFHTHTGYLNGKRLTVLSTGIGTDNIDIVLNELDALANIDFESREIRKRPTILKFIRIGTSGAIQNDIPVDAFLLSANGFGLDGLKHFYQTPEKEEGMVEAFVQQTEWEPKKAMPYWVTGDKKLKNLLNSNRIRLGCTLTNTGFYGPQQRNLRLTSSDSELPSKLAAFEHRGIRITNLEMETSAIYLLADLLGHRAISMNCILANRATGAFSKHPKKAVDSLIAYVLERLTAQAANFDTD